MSNQNKAYEELLKHYFALADVGQLPKEFYKKYDQVTNENVALYAAEIWLTQECQEYLNPDGTIKSTIYTAEVSLIGELIDRLTIKPKKEIPG